MALSLAFLAMLRKDIFPCHVFPFPLCSPSLCAKFRRDQSWPLCLEEASTGASGRLAYFDQLIQMHLGDHINGGESCASRNQAVKPTHMMLRIQRKARIARIGLWQRLQSDSLWAVCDPYMHFVRLHSIEKLGDFRYMCRFHFRFLWIWSCGNVELALRHRKTLARSNLAASSSRTYARVFSTFVWGVQILTSHRLYLFPWPSCPCWRDLSFYSVKSRHLTCQIWSSGIGSWTAVLKKVVELIRKEPRLIDDVCRGTRRGAHCHL